MNILRSLNDLEGRRIITIDIVWNETTSCLHCLQNRMSTWFNRQSAGELWTDYHQRHFITLISASAWPMPTVVAHWEAILVKWNQWEYHDLTDGCMRKWPQHVNKCYLRLILFSNQWIWEISSITASEALYSAPISLTITATRSWIILQKCWTRTPHFEVKCHTYHLESKSRLGHPSYAHSSSSKVADK